MQPQNIVTSHGVNIAPATYALFAALRAGAVAHDIYEATEYDPTTGEIKDVNLIVWSKDIHIMTDTKQDTPAEPQPETPPAGEGDKPKLPASEVEALFDAQDAVANQAARILELEAALARSQEKHKRAEAACKELADKLKMAELEASNQHMEVVCANRRTEELEAENERLKTANARLTEQLLPQPKADDGSIGKHEALAEIDKLRKQVHELQNQLADRSRESSKIAANGVSVYEFRGVITEPDGRAGKLWFAPEAGNPKTVNGDKTRIVPSDHPSPDELAALPIHVQKSVRDNKQAIYVLHTALNRIAYEGMYDD